MSTYGQIRLGSGGKLEKNNSGRFESRWSQVDEDDDNLFFKDEGLIWNLYGTRRRKNMWIRKMKLKSSPVKYMDYEHRVTEKYPMNLMVRLEVGQLFYLLMDVILP